MPNQSIEPTGASGLGHLLISGHRPLAPARRLSCGVRFLIVRFPLRSRRQVAVTSPFGSAAFPASEGTTLLACEKCMSIASRGSSKGES